MNPYTEFVLEIIQKLEPNDLEKVSKAITHRLNGAKIIDIQVNQSSHDVNSTDKRVDSGISKDASGERSGHTSKHTSKHSSKHVFSRRNEKAKKDSNKKLHEAKLDDHGNVEPTPKSGLGNINLIKQLLSVLGNTDKASITQSIGNYRANDDDESDDNTDAINTEKSNSGELNLKSILPAAMNADLLASLPKLLQIGNVLNTGSSKEEGLLEAFLSWCPAEKRKKIESIRPFFKMVQIFQAIK